MIYQSKQFKQITLATVAILFVWPFGSWGAINSESRVNINESVEVYANTGGNYLHVNGDITELKTASAAVKVKIENIINGKTVTELNLIQDKAGELEKKVEYVSPDGSAAVSSEVNINVAGSGEQVIGNDTISQASKMPLNNTNQQTSDDKQQTTDDSQQITNNRQQITEGQEAMSNSRQNNILVIISNFFTNILQSLTDIFNF